MSNLDNLRFSLSPSCLKQVKAVHAFPLFVLLHAMVDAPHARSSSSFTSSPTLDRPPSAASSWTSFTKTASLFPRRRFRLAFLLALSTAFTLWMSMLLFYSTQQKPPKTSGSEQVALNLNATPEPIEPLHITWPQFRSWQTDSNKAWVANDADHVQQQPFLRALQTYTAEGHSAEALHELSQKTIVNTREERHQLPRITAMIHITDKKYIKSQFSAVLGQSLSVNAIVLLCSSDLQQSVEYHARRLDTNTTIKVMTVDKPASPFGPGSAGQSSWLQVIHTVEDTDYIWVLESGTLPGSQYLEYVFGLSRSAEYRDAVLGDHASLLPANLHYQEDTIGDLLCLPNDFGVLPNRSQAVDALHGAWLIKNSWVPFLTDVRHHALSLPISYHVSRSLLKLAAIPSVVLPTHPDPRFRLSIQHDHCDNLHDDYHKNDRWSQLRRMRTSPTALDYRQRTLLKLETVLFIADGPEQAIALHPLFCRFRSPVHVVVTGARRGLTGKSLEDVLRSTECANAGSVFVHDLDLTTADDLAAASAAATETSRLIHALRPSVLIHVHRDQPMFHVLNSLARAEGLTAIGLPAGEIRHALWLSELSIKTLQRWHDVELDVVVITDRRPHSLSRLLQSTNSAYYLGDAVNLKLHLEQTADRVTRMLVNGYTWRHGKKIVRHRIQKGGLMPAIVESWYPSSDHNYAVLLEDDIEVSPLYYVWAKYSILKYRYSENATQLMYGISLYSPRHLELLPQGRRPFDPVQAIGDEYHARIPYLTQVPCSWGAVYFPEHWREFHGYLTSRLEDLRQYQLLNISVPNSRSQRWKKSWKKYFIELVYLRGYVMLYPNFQHFESFSTNHLEFGTHIKKERTNSLDEFLVPLMQRDTILSQLPGERLPDFDGLPVLDLWGQRVSHPLLESIGAEWHKNVSACPRAPLGRFDPQDLLCPFVRPTKKAKVVPKKTGEPHQAVEPLEYVTVYIDAVEPIQDDLAPKPIDISQMTTVESEITHEDDEFRDMAQDVERLVALAQTFTTTTTTITTTTTNPH